MALNEEATKNKENNPFDLTGRVVVITGGAGLLGQKHAEAVAENGGIPVLVDIDFSSAQMKAKALSEEFGVKAQAIQGDITSRTELKKVLDSILKQFDRVDVLINNAANNPKMESKSGKDFSRLENFPEDQWEKDIAVGLTGAFLCSQVFGAEMAKRKKGVIINVASDLAVIAPDQRLYAKEGVPSDQQPVKPVTYSVVKTGLIGLTRYLATYWADKGVRANAISLGGVENNQPKEFVEKLSKLIPQGRMAKPDEYKGAIAFLCSDASSYMNGQNLIMDGGRTCW